MAENKLEFGKKAERVALEFLKEQGYKILECNYRTKFGEVDIVAVDKDVLCFVEVKARHSLDLGEPAEAVSVRKQRQIAKAALSYLKINHRLDQLARFDVLTLLYQDESPKINLIKDAFELNTHFTI
ncbi:MAG: YraN family protein [Candidatus Omnitrophota bacterium]